MGDIITRKCAACKGIIEIDRNNISNVIQFQKKYYHYDCFEALATAKAAVKTGKPKMWQDALDNIWVLEDETRKAIEYFVAKDNLNAWLLDNYDIVSVPSYFWQVVAELENGVYRNKRCKPVKTFDLYECWKWGQRKLNEINIGNRMNHKGPGNDSERLCYDLAILITKYPLFLKHKSKASAQIINENLERQQPKIDYGLLEKNNKHDDDNDILDLMDEVF